MTTQPTTTTRAATAPVQPDLYSNIHKALRALMFDTVARIGRVDVHDADDLGQALDQTERLLAHLTSHLQHENEFVHTAIEARRPTAASVTAAAHDDHLEAIAELTAEVALLRAGADAPRRAQRLYQQLARFVADNIEHMHLEETTNHATLCALYSADELALIHDRIVAHLDPMILMEALSWMARALNPQELAELYAQLQAKVPPEPFAALLQRARENLDDTRWAKLARALQLPPVPGLVAV